MVFPKKLRWNMYFLYYRERRYFFFPKIWSYTLDRKLKMIFLKKKKSKNMIFSSNMLKRWSFQKGPLCDMILLVLSWKMVFFSRKHDNFSIGRKVRNDLSQEIHGNMIFSVYTYGRYKLGTTPLCQKKSKMVLSRKNTPEGDWRSRLTF